MNATFTAHKKSPHKIKLSQWKFCERIFCGMMSFCVPGFDPMSFCVPGFDPAACQALILILLRARL
jgi:hypothetical protein